jgi:hypothetical protein
VAGSEVFIVGSRNLFRHRSRGEDVCIDDWHKRLQ